MRAPAGLPARGRLSLAADALTIFLNALATGIGVGSVYALVALGYSFIIRTTGVFNMAQGVFLAYGSLLTYTFYQSHGWPAAAAAVAVALAVALIGVTVERVAVWPVTRGSDTSLNWILSTLGAGVLLTGIAERVWGTLPLPVDNYLPFRIVSAGDIIVQSPYVLAFFAAIAIAVLVELVQRFTLMGKILRAMGENRTAVELAGVNVLRAGMVAFLVGGAIAGFGGFVLAPITFAQANAGFGIAILSFAALAIGGFGNHWGGIVGGWVVGVVGNVGATYFGLQYQSLLIFATLVVVLIVRPEGIASRHAVRTV